MLQQNLTIQNEPFLIGAMDVDMLNSFVQNGQDATVEIELTFLY